MLEILLLTISGRRVMVIGYTKEADGKKDILASREEAFI
jgi:hypothetical protein